MHVQILVTESQLAVVSFCCAGTFSCVLVQGPLSAPGLVAPPSPYPFLFLLLPQQRTMGGSLGPPVFSILIITHIATFFISAICPLPAPPPSPSSRNNPLIESWLVFFPVFFFHLLSLSLFPLWGNVFVVLLRVLPATLTNYVLWWCAVVARTSYMGSLPSERAAAPARKRES